MKTFMSDILQWLEQFNKELIQILEEEYQILLKETEEEAANRSLTKNYGHILTRTRRLS